MLLKLMKLGLATPFVLNSPHQAAPWPSMVPLPLIVTSCKLEPLMKGVELLGQLPKGSIISVAPLSICRFTLLLIPSGPHKYGDPAAGISTIPPAELVAAALMAFWIAVVFVLMPSPTAPKLVTLKILAGLLVGKGGGKTASANLAEPSRIRQERVNFVELILRLQTGSRIGALRSARFGNKSSAR